MLLKTLINTTRKASYSFVFYPHCFFGLDATFSKVRSTLEKFDNRSTLKHFIDYINHISNRCLYAHSTFSPNKLCLIFHLNSFFYKNLITIKIHSPFIQGRTYLTLNLYFFVLVNFLGIQTFHNIPECICIISQNASVVTSQHYYSTE